MRKLNSFLLLILGAALVLLFFQLATYGEEKKLSFSGQVGNGVVSDFRLMPVKIKIPSLEIELIIGETTIKNGIWEVYPFGASHLAISSYPGGGGNIVIYAHNKKNFFGLLTRIKKGDIVEIQNASGEEFRYEVKETVETDPDNMAYVLPKESETLTLYTCSGFLDKKRFIVLAKPI